MKTLLAVRHAKPEIGFQGKDHDRPLGTQGIQDCRRMGQHLLREGFKPGTIISSTAERARTTANLLANELGFPTENIIKQSNGYLAPRDHWLGVVQQLPEHTSSAIIVGHNPGMADFSVEIQKDPEYLNFPPLAIAKLQFEVEFWGEIDWKTGTLINFLNPSNI